jgi:hypothetical protein
MDESFFPPNLKRSVHGYRELFVICPICQTSLNIGWLYPQILHDIEKWKGLNKRYQEQEYYRKSMQCPTYKCDKCRTTLTIKAFDGKCTDCANPINCLLDQPLVELHKRMVYKPYSKIRPSCRVTIWE